MNSSRYWLGHFRVNAGQQRINWNIKPQITPEEISTILSSLQAWQLGETSEGRQLIAVATRYAWRTQDPVYIDVMKLFIKEEQKHGENLGQYLDRIEQPRIKANWGDTLFRKVRHLNATMEMWTLAVIAVESIAQIFYQALKEATGCPLLKEICTDILIDEAYHITFQTERLSVIYEQKGTFAKWCCRMMYKYFFYATSCLVWFAHKSVFVAGGDSFTTYLRKISYKYRKTIQKVTQPLLVQWI